MYGSVAVSKMVAAEGSTIDVEGLKGYVINPDYRNIYGI